MGYTPWRYQSRMNKARNYILELPRVHRTLWLDIGCGSGISTIPLIEELPPRSRVCGLDRKYNSLRFFKQKIPKNKTTQIHIIIADFHNLPFRRNAWEGCLLSFSLHETRNHSQLIRELYSVLSTSGMLVVIDYQVEYCTPWISPSKKISKSNLLSLLRDNGLKSPIIHLNGNKHYMISTIK